MSEIPPPQWQTGKPDKPCLVVGFSARPERNPGLAGAMDEPDIYEWTGDAFQHHSGWYDHAITHWIKLGIDYDRASPPHPRGEG